MPNDGSAARNNALYSFSRSVAMALICCGVFTFHNLAYLAAVSIMMIVVAGIDGVIGRKISKLRTWLPWGMAVVNLVVLLMVYAHFFLKYGSEKNSGVIGPRVFFGEIMRGRYGRWQLAHHH
ncbi:hypothetical protein [Lacticaseibacillus thailandensis]|uniref:hypothetical protein n=1 Tax=Lacticaseibacillus thailandensis TaxID=381741 RepID=UPI0012E2A7DB|nr:hypothetical protein [Lacticaseibacillus thailandensis]